MKLRYTLPALADLSAILDYIATQSPQGAHRVQTRIQALTDLLLQYSHIGQRTNDPAIRRMTTKPYPYLVFYEATEAEIIFMPSGMPRVTPLECPAPPNKRRMGELRWPGNPGSLDNSGRNPQMSRRPSGGRRRLFRR